MSIGAFLKKINGLQQTNGSLGHLSKEPNPSTETASTDKKNSSIERAQKAINLIRSNHNNPTSVQHDFSNFYKNDSQNDNGIKFLA